MPSLRSVSPSLGSRLVTMDLNQIITMDLDKITSIDSIGEEIKKLEMELKIKKLKMVRKLMEGRKEAPSPHLLCPNCSLRSRDMPAHHRHLQQCHQQEEEVVEEEEEEEVVEDEEYLERCA